MAEEYLVLRGLRSLATTKPRKTGARVRTGGGQQRSAPMLVAQGESLENTHLVDLRADPDVLVGRTLPTALIEPMEESHPNAGDAAWGLTAVKATESSCTGKGVVVAVLDTGIVRKHEAFDDMDIAEEDFTGTGNGDGHGHGTHCASSIFGRDVGGQRIGVARGVTRALVGKVLSDKGRGSSASLIKAMLWALEAGAQVISLSLGFDFPGMVKRLQNDGWPAEAATSRALEDYRNTLRMFDAVLGLAQARIPYGGGAVIVAATGNENRPPHEIAASLPAAARGVLSVAAASRNDDNRLSIAGFSNRLPALSAPGVGILGADRATNALILRSGTSMAAPHVSGVAALWWERKRAGRTLATSTAVEAALRENATPDPFLPEFGPRDFGAGLVTAPT